MLALLWLAEVEEARGNHNSALEDLRKVVAAQPTNSHALNNLAYLLSEFANKPDEALSYAEKAQELAPDDPESFSTLSGGFFTAKDSTLFPLRHLERAASHHPGSAVWNYHLAMAYAKTGDLNRGRSTLAVALKRNRKFTGGQSGGRLIGRRYSVDKV